MAKDVKSLKGFVTFLKAKGVEDVFELSDTDMDNAMYTCGLKQELNKQLKSREDVASE